MPEPAGSPASGQETAEHETAAQTAAQPATAQHAAAIVGGGPVGLLLACLLAQQGIDVVVFERRAQPSTSSRAIGIHPPGFVALVDAGVGQQVRAQALRLGGGSAHSAGRLLAAFGFAAAGRSQRLVLTLPQHRTEALLRERLEQLRPGALRTGVEVLAVRQFGDQVRLELASGSAATAGGVITAAIAVAADGVRSSVRQSLGIGWRPRPGRADYLMADFPDAAATEAAAGTAAAVQAAAEPAAETSAAPWARLHCEPAGVVESLPLPGGLRRWVVLDRSTVPPSPAAVAGIVAERTGAMLGPGVAGTASRFTARQHLAASFAHGRIVLLGDAAHEVSPIGGQGMNLGWSGARRLAPAIIAALAGGVPDFRRYRRVQRRAAALVQRRARFNMAMGMPAAGPRRVLRDLLLRLLGTRPLRRLAVGAFTMRGV